LGKGQRESTGNVQQQHGLVLESKAEEGEACKENIKETAKQTSFRKNRMTNGGPIEPKGGGKGGHLKEIQKRERKKHKTKEFFPDRENGGPKDFNSTERVEENRVDQAKKERPKRDLYGKGDGVDSRAAGEGQGRLSPLRTKNGGLPDQNIENKKKINL